MSVNTEPAWYQEIMHKKLIHPDIEKQNFWLNEYQLNPIHVGAMCDQYPGLMLAWKQFKTTYEMCNSNETNRQIP